MSAAGKLVGVGVGPGDPELITLKAVRVLRKPTSSYILPNPARPGTPGRSPSATCGPVFASLR